MGLYSMFLVKERSMAEQVGQLMDEKCKVLETLSKCQQEVGWLLTRGRACLRHTWDQINFNFHGVKDTQIRKHICVRFRKKNHFKVTEDHFGHIITLLRFVLFNALFAVWWPGELTTGRWGLGPNWKDRTSGGILGNKNNDWEILLNTLILKTLISVFHKKSVVFKSNVTLANLVSNYLNVLNINLT